MKNTKKGNLALVIQNDSHWSLPLNYSGSEKYLKEKMKAHRKKMGANNKTTYGIIDELGNIKY